MKNEQTSESRKIDVSPLSPNQGLIRERDLR
jgi:hypothetical protein